MEGVREKLIMSFGTALAYAFIEAIPTPTA